MVAVKLENLPVKQTLAELVVPRSTLYAWYRRYSEQGFAGLAQRQPPRRLFWNRIPDALRQCVVEIALERTELSPRQLAWHITVHEGYFISESSVDRILKT